MSACLDGQNGTVLAKSCIPGLYCPYYDANNISATAPVYCNPTTECVFNRMLGKVCPAQGKYEPIICKPGNYCPTPLEMIQCPKGYYCPTGSIDPIKCDMISICPVGATSQTSLNGIVTCLILDFALMVSFYWLKYQRNQLVLKTDKTHSGSGKDKLIISSNKMPDSPQADGEEAVIKIPPPPTKTNTLKNSLADNFKKSMNGTDLRMHFEIDNLGFKLKSGKEILKGVTGNIKAGKMTAIMGPSGAGKTTFMNLLCGKVQRTSGTLKISGKEAELASFKKICGFVPQEDIMHPELTVRENILHSTRIRAPKNWSSKEVEEHTDCIIDALNLSHVAHSFIGDGVSRGISGGQRKRVNIGMELAATPLCLFLDEPTSGLDSTSSLEVMDILQKISSIGVTVVAVIHQPRTEIFKKFNDVLMIAPGGLTAYLGPTIDAKSYFENQGFEFPVGSNEADVLMDILSGQGINNKEELPLEKLISNWSAQSRLNESEKVSQVDPRDEDFHKLSNVLVSERGANWFWQFWYAHNLSVVQQYRSIGGLVLELFVSGYTGFIMGLSLNGSAETYVGVLKAPFSALSTSPNFWMTVQVQMLMGCSIALAASPAGTKVFSEELQIYWRKASSGHSPSAYFIAKSVSSIYRMTLGALHFAAFIFPLANPIIPFGIYFFGILLTFYGVYGLGAFVSMVVRRENATLLAVVIALLSAVFCGYGLTITKVKKWGIFFIWALQFNMWNAEANYSHTLLLYDHVFDNDLGNVEFGYTLGRSAFDYGMMILIGSAWRMYAYIAMVFLNRDKQK